MTRLLICLLGTALTGGCMHTPPSAHEECHVEAGWLDSTSGCAEREGYPDCWKVCADGSRERVGSRAAAASAQPQQPPLPAPPPPQPPAPPH